MARKGALDASHRENIHADCRSPWVLRTVLAEVLGEPKPWQYSLQPPGTPLMHQVEDFHTFLMIIIASIVALVLGLLLIIIVRFNARANPTPSRTTHNTLVEVLWTVVPVVILVTIAISSFSSPLSTAGNSARRNITVNITGNKWYWSYEYPDNGGLASIPISSAMRKPMPRASRAILPPTIRWSFPRTRRCASSSLRATSSMPGRFPPSARRSTRYPAG